MVGQDGLEVEFHLASRPTLAYGSTPSCHPIADKRISSLHGSNQRQAYNHSHTSKLMGVFLSLRILYERGANSIPVKTRSRKNRTVQCHIVLCSDVLRVLIPNLVTQSPLHSQTPISPRLCLCKTAASNKASKANVRGKVKSAHIT
jgi:hypothetical protein